MTPKKLAQNQLITEKKNKSEYFLQRFEDEFSFFKY